MRLVFAGTPAFAAIVLSQLLLSKHELVAVYTQPDRPAGRGQKLKTSEVKQLALAQHQIIEQPATLKNELTQQTLRAYQADAIVVAAYGLLLPQSVLDIPTYGCINIHPSLLPRWRGATPLQSTLLAGDTISGVSIMQMVREMDAGPILMQEKTAVGENETCGQLHDRLADMGCRLLLKVLDNVQQITPEVQAETGITYAQKINKNDGQLDWQQTARQLHNRVRAFNPLPGAFSYLDKQLVKIWKTTCLRKTTDTTPGTIIAVQQDAITVACGQGELSIHELQLAGGKRLPIAAILNGKKELFAVGQRFSDHG